MKKGRINVDIPQIYFKFLVFFMILFLHWLFKASFFKKVKKSGRKIYEERSFSVEFRHFFWN